METIKFKDRWFGTCDIMEYVDEHPKKKFDHAFFKGVGAPFVSFIVSDFEPGEAFVQLDEEGMHDWHTNLPNGWQRLVVGQCAWICRKNNRYILITG